MNRASLLAIQGPGMRRLFALSGQPVTMGRAADNGVVLEATHASRYHARLDWVDGHPQLTDLGSANGTFLNNQRLVPNTPHPVQSGDTFQIANLQLALSTPAEGRDLAAQPLPGGKPAALTRAEPGTVVLRVDAARLSEEIVLQQPIISLGRDPANDITIDRSVVSRRHARLERVPEGYQIFDLDSGNGLTYQGTDIPPATAMLLADGDVLWIAEDVSLTYRITPLPAAAVATGLPAAPPVEAPVPTPMAAAIADVEPAPVAATMVGIETPSRGLRKINLGQRTELTVGRSPDNDLHLDYPTVSRHHARISRVGPGQEYVIEDLRSSNGTVVNGERIPPGKPYPLHPGSTLRIGPIRFILAPDVVELVDESRHMRLDALHLKKEVGKGINLLQDISLAILPREFVAVVGVSGAGKSTLLKALAGTWPATGGTILVNETDLYRHYDTFRTDLGYVPQDDIIHMELSAEKALDYAARLRLPRDITAQERSQAVTEELETLGLEERRKVPVGSLSGGQRKRVSIGVERLTGPGLFFLDEATSGLDPGTENQMMRLLRKLADEGQTILLVTHATKNVMRCDQVVFLAKGGNLAYFGPPAEALDYFGVTDFDEIYEKLYEEKTPEEWAAHYRGSTQYREYVVKRLQATYGELLDVRPEAAAGGGAGPAARSLGSLRAKIKRPAGFRQFAVLTMRYLDIIRSDRMNLLLLFLIAPVLGAMDLIAWQRDIFDPVTGDASHTMVMLFFSCIIPFLVGALSSVREVVKEKAVYHRERAVNLRIIPYLGSKVVVGLLFALYHAAALLGLKLLAVDLGHMAVGDILLFYLLLVVAVMSGVMWGLLISALAPREEQAMLLVIIVVVVQMIFSGGILPLEQLGGAGEAIGYATSSKWALEAEVDVTQVMRGECDGPSLERCEVAGIQAYGTDAERHVVLDALEERYGAVLEGDLVNSVIAQVGIMVVLFVLLAVVQKRKDVI